MASVMGYSRKYNRQMPSMGRPERSTSVHLLLLRFVSIADEYLVLAMEDFIHRQGSYGVSCERRIHHHVHPLRIWRHIIEHDVMPPTGLPPLGMVLRNEKRTVPGDKRDDLCPRHGRGVPPLRFH